MTRLWARRLGAALSLVAVAAIGWLDFTTGPEFGVSLFYLLPIAASAWLLGYVPGIAVAVIAAAAWLLADMAWHAETLLVYQWNAFTRLVIYVVVAWLVALARADRERLAALNEKLAKALGTETELARRDRLTSLANSRKFHELLAEEMRMDGRAICVALVDVDNFKNVNDRFGHSAGDELLRRIATDLIEATRSSDAVARIGGDEFAILFRRVSPHDATRIGRRIVERVRIAGEAWPGTDVGASVGIAWFPAPPRAADEVVQAADSAMYAAKAAGKGEVRVTFGGPPDAKIAPDEVDPAAGE